MTSQTGLSSEGKLSKNSVGLAHIVFFVVAAAAPLTAVVGATPAAFAFGNGAGVPGAFVLSGALYLLFAVGFATMSRYVGSAGGFYTYIAQGLGKPAAIGGAMMALVAYSAIQLAVYGLFGVFMVGAMQPLGIEAPWFVWSFVLLAIVLVCGQRNIAFSGAILGVCMIGEIVILLLLDLAILHHGSAGGFSLSSFTPSVVFQPGLGVALVFVLGSFIGFEATTIFGEEAENPDRTIPRATYLAVILITGFYAFSTWAIVQYYGADKVQEAAASNIEGFYFQAAETLLGRWSVQAMNVLLITSLFACVLSFHNTINRYFFALGREGVILRALGAVHARHGSPHVAGLVQSGLAAIVLGFFVAAGADPYAVVFSWMAALSVIGILAVQIMVCLAVVMFFRKMENRPDVWKVLVAPLVSLIGLAGGLLLVIGNLSLLAGSDSMIVQAFPYLMLLVGLVGAAFALQIKGSRPELYAALGKAFE
ncbi:APC family permease [Allorhizobium undicola]|uniref:APC family permease n=1 Tax=Allorhizobium undicola TaxID=78527 RepID=UPI003D33E8F2